MSHTSRHSILLLALTAIACHSGGTAPPTPFPSERVPPITVAARVALADEWSSDVTVVQEDSILLAIPDGSKQLERRVRRANFRLNVTPGNHLSLRLDSVSYNPALPIQDGSVGTIWTGQIDRDGRITSLMQSRHNALTDMLETTVRTILPRMPHAGVAPGMTWRDTIEGSLQVDVYRTDEERTATWSVGKRVNHDALILQPVSVEEKFEQLGKGSVIQRQSTMSAQGGRKGTWFLTLLGRIDNAMVVDSVAKLVTITGTRDPVSTIEFSRMTIWYR